MISGARAFALAGGWLVLTCGACQLLVPRREAPPEGPLPAQFSLQGSGPAASDRWWQDFGSPELDSLVEESLRGNLTLRQAWARLDQAGAGVVSAASGLYPHLDLTGDAGWRRAVTTVETDSPSFRSRLRDALLQGAARGLDSAVRQVQAGGGSTGGSGGGTGLSASSLLNAAMQEQPPTRVTRETRRFGLSLAAGYEVDLWGRVAAGYRAADLELQATREELESTAMTLAGEVADRWLRILEQQELRRILDEQLATNRTYLELVELRFRKGQVSALDVYQQRQAVSDVQRQIPLVQAREELLRHDLAVLLGRPPATELEIGDHELTDVPDEPVAGIPAQLLTRRPDVRAALARLNAADQRVAAARADQLPAIRLTGGVGLEADRIDNVLDDWFLNLAGGLSAPLFDGLRREAEVQRTLAVVEERLADYRLTVLRAIREVEDALAQERRQRAHIEALERQFQDAGNALRQAGGRYLKGLSDYLPVLAALERTQSLARGLVVGRRELLGYRLQLYRALGGTWTRQLAEPVRLSREVPATRSSAS